MDAGLDGTIWLLFSILRDTVIIFIALASFQLQLHVLYCIVQRLEWLCRQDRGCRE